jgi:hypothetical protein
VKKKKKNKIEETKNEPWKNRRGDVEISSS